MNLESILDYKVEPKYIQVSRSNSLKKYSVWSYKLNDLRKQIKIHNVEDCLRQLAQFLQ